MFRLTYIAARSSGTDTLDYGIRDLFLDGGVLHAISGNQGGITSWALSADGVHRLIAEQPFTADQGQMFRSGFFDWAPGGNEGLFVIGNSAGLAFQAGTNGSGGITGLSRLADLGKGVVTAAAGLGPDYLVIASEDRSGITLVKRAGDGSLGSAQYLPDDASVHIDDVDLLQSVDVGSKRFVVAGDSAGQGLAVFSLGPGDQLEQHESFGPETGLGMMVPTDIAVAKTGGSTYLLVGSAQGEAGALSALRLTGDGRLTPSDHLLDTHHTRFGATQAVASVSYKETVFVIAGGGDAGLSLFVLLKTGQLVHLDALEDTTDRALGGVETLAAAMLGSTLQIFAATQRDAGVSQTRVSLGDFAGQQLAALGGGLLQGSSEADILVGQEGADDIRGGAGDDVIIDGAGSDTLYGGGGADRFVMSGDDTEDIIRDFDPTQDVIDLGGWSYLQAISSLSIASTGSGAIIDWRDERLRIVSADNASLSVDDIVAALTIGPNRVYSPPSLALTGTGGADELTGSWGQDTLDGAGGNDELKGLGGDDLLKGGAGDDRLRGGAGSDELRGGEGDDRAWGDEDDDTIYGNGGDDKLFGDGGDDRLFGGDGNDRLEGGTGRDELDGGGGKDRIFDAADGTEAKGGGGADLIAVSGGTNRLEGGGGDDELLGGFGHDDLRGDGGNDILRGEQGVGHFGSGDRLEGGAGNDLLMGGPGADVFVFRPNSGEDVIAGFAPGTRKAKGADFTPGFDEVQLLGFSGLSQDTVRSHLRDTADGAVFEHSGTSIVFWDIDKADISAWDFLL